MRLVVVAYAAAEVPLDDRSASSKLGPRLHRSRRNFSTRLLPDRPAAGWPDVVGARNSSARAIAKQARLEMDSN